MTIVYRKEGGRASDLRFVRDDYSPEAGEIAIEGDVLPDIETLHDEAYRTELAKATANAEVISALGEIDLKSIRCLREWLVAQPDAPQFIKDHEAAATSERAKLEELTRKSRFRSC